MHHTITHNLSNYPNLKRSNPVCVKFMTNGLKEAEYTLPIDLLMVNVALISYKPHPLVELELRRILSSSVCPIAISKAPYFQLAQHAQAALEGRWNGIPWRWEQIEAAQLFSHLHGYVGDLKGEARQQAQEQLAYTAKSVARAFMAPPDAERELMPHGLTAHEGALVLVIHCAATIAKHMEAVGLPEDECAPQWAECVETLEATLELVKWVAIPGRNK